MTYTEHDWTHIFCRWFEEHHKTLHHEPWFNLDDHHVRFMEFLLDCSPDSDPPINRTDLISELEPLCDRRSIQIVRQSRWISCAKALMNCIDFLRWILMFMLSIPAAILFAMAEAYSGCSLE